MLKKFFNVKTIIFTILAILILFLIPKMYGLLMILFASFVFAAALNPLVNKLQDKIKNRALSASIIVITAIFTIFALILPIIVMCYKEIELLINIENLYIILFEMDDWAYMDRDEPGKLLLHSILIY